MGGRWALQCCKLEPLGHKPPYSSTSASSLIFQHLLVWLDFPLPLKSVSPAQSCSWSVCRPLLSVPGWGQGVWALFQNLPPPSQVSPHPTAAFIVWRPRGDSGPGKPAWMEGQGSCGTKSG